MKHSLTAPNIYWEDNGQPEGDHIRIISLGEGVGDAGHAPEITGEPLDGFRFAELHDAISHCLEICGGDPLTGSQHIIAEKVTREGRFTSVTDVTDWFHQSLADAAIAEFGLDAVDDFRRGSCALYVSDTVAHSDLGLGSHY